jgi:hypothetical protein
MFSAIEIRELLAAQPFRPFRIIMSSGQAYDITNHDMAIVSRNSVDVESTPARTGSRRGLSAALSFISTRLKSFSQHDGEGLVCPT